MLYRRMPIEIESPEGLGYDRIDCNLSESSFTDQRLSDLGISLEDIVLLYGNHQGKTELRELIAAGIGMHPDDILITPGAAAALFMSVTAFLNPGDHIVVAKSNYATNIETPRAIGANVSYLPMQFETRYALDLDELDALITDKTKLVSLTYPHNPTGVTIDEDMLRQIIALVERKKTYLLFDETYREMSFTKPLPVAATLSRRVISITSMSKSFGLPGIRMGWLLCRDKKWMNTLLAAKEQILITNSVIDEEIAYRYLQKKDILFAPVQATIRRNFEVLKNFMSEQTELEWIEPGGGCVCFPRVRKDIRIDMPAFHDRLLDQYGTYVGRGHWFEEEDRFMRIGYSWEITEKLKRGLSNIINCIEDLVHANA